MAALLNKDAMEEFLTFARSMGLRYSPLSAEEIEKIANDPFAYESMSVVEDRIGNVSGYYQKGPNGWNLVAIGPSQGVGVFRKRDWAKLPKVEGWATPQAMRNAKFSYVAAVGDIVYNVDHKKVVRLAEVLEVDETGYPTLVRLAGVDVDPNDVDGVWERLVGREEISREFYNKGKTRFKKLFDYSTQAGKRAAYLEKVRAGKTVRNYEEKPPITPEEAEDMDFLAQIKRAQRSRERK